MSHASLQLSPFRTLLLATSLVVLVWVCTRSMTFPMQRLPSPLLSALQLRVPSLFEAPPTRWEMLSLLLDIKLRSTAFDPLVNPPTLLQVPPLTLRTLLLTLCPLLHLAGQQAVPPRPWLLC